MVIFVDTHGLTGYEPQTDEQSKYGSVGRKSKSLRGASWSWTEFIEPPMKKYTKLHRGSDRSQLSEYTRRATCLLAGARQKRVELSSSRLRKSSSRTSAISVMKFLLQLHNQPKCLERKMWERMDALENQAEQTWTSHQVSLMG